MTPPLAEQTVVLEQSEVQDLTQRNEAKLQELERQTGVKVVLRGNILKLMGKGEDSARARKAVEDLLAAARRDGPFNLTEFRGLLKQALLRRDQPASAVSHSSPTHSPGFDKPLSEVIMGGIPLPLKRRRLSPITPGQKEYLEAIQRKDITFGIGPAGTGKTYLAVAMAVSHLISGKVSRIILCRPAVEAGEKLGFLPGDMKEKLDPYVRPLYDALYEMMDAEKIKQALETGVIEIAPLAFMRGRTLNNSFIILDEAQNTTPEQMKMFLTRLGFESKAVITGDVTQIDLPSTHKSGLIHVQSILKSLDDIAFVYFAQEDVVRHDLVMKIVKAYEKHENRPGVPPTRRRTQDPPAAPPKGDEGQ